MGFFHGQRPSPESEGKDDKSPQQHKQMTPQLTPTPIPDTLPSFDGDCFGPGGRFLIPTPATGAGAAGRFLGFLGLGNVPNVPGLTDAITDPIKGVNAHNAQAVLDNLRAARTFMNNSAMYHNQLGNQNQAIDNFQNFCSQHGWPVH